MIDQETGEEVGCLVPESDVDRDMLRERGFVTGSQLRAVLAKPRDVVFFRLAHRVGKWVAENAEGYRGLSAHEALKRVQERSGVGCAEETFDLGELGTIKRMRAESLSFEDMDEGRWKELWTGWIEYLRESAYPGASKEAVDAVESLITGEKELWRCG